MLNVQAVEAAFPAYSPLLTSVTWPGETLATVVNVPRPPSAYSQLLRWTAVRSGAGGSAEHSEELEYVIVGIP